MITKMTKYTFALMSDGTNSFLEGLQAIGLVDITRSTKPVDDHSAALFAKAEELSKLITRIENDDFTRDASYVELAAQLEAARKELAAREPWGEFEPEKFAQLEAMGYSFKYYTAPSKKFDATWAEQYAIQVVNAEADITRFVVVCAQGEQPELPAQQVEAPRGTAAQAQAQIEELTAKIEERKAVLSAQKSELPTLKAQHAEELRQIELYLAGSSCTEAAEGYLSVFVGYAPTENDAQVQAELDKLDAYYSAEAAVAEEQPPIKFKNNKFVSMFEMLTDMYGRPAYDGFDPTPFISVFFLLFFAFCMGDAGYGIVLVLLGLLLKKVQSFAKLSPLVVTLGVGTIVVGTLFHTFFSTDMYEWSIIPDAVKSCFLPAKILGYDGTMVLALIVGVVHISLAMIVKTVMDTKNKGFLNALSTWGWTLLIVGGVAVGAFAFLGVIDAAVTKWIVIALGIISALGIFLLNDLHRNPLINIGSGLWETYNTATGLLGDVLSYLRLYALGLAGSMLGLAFNNIGMMIVGDGSSWLMWIPAVLVFIVGHTLNVAMAVLGAFVHPLRLNFLEFFKNSGYEGSGRVYNPLKK